MLEKKHIYLGVVVYICYPSTPEATQASSDYIVSSRSAQAIQKDHLKEGRGSGTGRKEYLSISIWICIYKKVLCLGNWRGKVITANSAEQRLLCFSRTNHFQESSSPEGKMGQKPVFMAMKEIGR